MPVSLSEPIAVATLFGHLLDLPEHPHKRDAQADDDAQKQHQSKRRTSAWQESGLGAEYTKAAGIIPPSSTLFDRTGAPSSRQRAAAGSVTNLDRTETPAVGRMHAPLHHVAIAVVVVGVVIAIIRITIIVVVISVGSVA